jgi:hypothetical protein
VSNQALRHLDPEAHEPGCLANIDAPWANLDETHLDIFCNCHRYTEPKILRNGSDVAWPAGWTEVQAGEWRMTQGLARGGLPT